MGATHAAAAPPRSLDNAAAEVHHHDQITNGKLAGGVATGTVRVKSPGCTGKANFKSRRTGR